MFFFCFLEIPFLHSNRPVRMGSGMGGMVTQVGLRIGRGVEGRERTGRGGNGFRRTLCEGFCIGPVVRLLAGKF